MLPPCGGFSAESFLNVCIFPGFFSPTSIFNPPFTHSGCVFTARPSFTLITVSNKWSNFKLWSCTSWWMLCCFPFAGAGNPQCKIAIVMCRAVSEDARSRWAECLHFLLQLKVSARHLYFKHHVWSRRTLCLVSIQKRNSVNGNTYRAHNYIRNKHLWSFIAMITGWLYL